jgi:glycosyltransferase involved in cell wall biosynthesis
MSDPKKQIPSISAIIITRNEAYNIKRCLETLGFCDEVVVVDSDSIDNTVAIARQLGARVIQTLDWPGFAVQKQRALSEAKSTWVLSIDADERVTPELRVEILKSISLNEASGYFIKRRSLFLGRWMRFGGWYPDYVLRLAKRECAYFDLVPVHERLIVNGPTQKLKWHLLHYSYYNVSDVLGKQKRYALLSAEKIQQRRGRQASVVAAVLRSLWAFNRLYLIQFGILDGRHGLISAIFKSQEVFWKYVAAEFDAEPPKNP